MSQVKVFPSERMDPEYPWTIWAVGWLAIFKAFLWLAYEPVQVESVLRLLGAKFLLNTIPLVILAIGIWNRKKMGCLGSDCSIGCQFDIFYRQSANPKRRFGRIGSSYLFNYFIFSCLTLQRSPRRYLHPLRSCQYVEAC